MGPAVKPSKFQGVPPVKNEHVHLFIYFFNLFLFNFFLTKKRLVSGNLGIEVSATHYHEGVSSQTTAPAWQESVAGNLTAGAKGLRTRPPAPV